MGMVKEFKEFAMKGNVMDMAVGIIIGGAFGKIIASFVSDILMPPIGLLLGGGDYKTWVLKLKEGAEGVAPVTVNIGTFLGTVIDFLIIAFAIFMVIKGMNSFKKKQEEAPVAPPEPPADVKLLTEIRDLLKK